MMTTDECKLGWQDCECADDQEYAEDWHRGLASKTDADLRKAYRKAADQLESWCFDDIAIDRHKARMALEPLADEQLDEPDYESDDMLADRKADMEEARNMMGMLKETLSAHVERIDKAIDTLNDELEG